MPTQDKLHRYLFAKAAVRGELVTVSETWQHILANHDYPPAVQKLLGEMLVITSLMTATLKFEGDITVQLQGDGPLSMAVINGNDQQQLRGVARVKGDIAEESTLQQMVGEGYLIITITPVKGERYQGVVALEGLSITECIEDYFKRSEQLPTKLFIRQDNSKVAGILLQVLPSDTDPTEQFEHLATLTSTVTLDELTNLAANEVLWRLYHQEEVTVFEPQPIEFKCSCSHTRCGEVLRTVDAEEIDKILQEDGKIEMHCDYCGTTYHYDAIDVATLRHPTSHEEPDTTH